MRNISSHHLTATTRAVICLSVLLLGNAVLAEADTPTKAAKTVKSAAQTPEGQLPLEELRTFSRVLEQIRETYVEEVDDKTLLENAIRGMLSELDPHSAYLDENDFNDLQNMTSGEFGGIGIEVGIDEGVVKVISPIDDTPASRAGIRAGDIIIKLNNKSLQGMSLDEAINLMRGKIGEPLQMVIVRKNIEQPIELKLVRDSIKIHSVQQKVLEPGYGYVRISQFQINTAEELNKALADLKKEHALRGLVIDLRNNPGGLLQSAVEVSDIFIDHGLIVYTKGRAPHSSIQYSADPGDTLNGAPIVVLINEGTASAAEIVAGALQDNHRATLLGTKSFGKGSVQTVIPISETKAIKLTTALYYTPSGRSIQAEGIKPDIVDELAGTTRAETDFRTTEADLNKHLGNGNADKKHVSISNKGVPQPSDTGKDTAAIKNDGWKGEDNQLHDALNTLKSMRSAKH